MSRLGSDGIRPDPRVFLKYYADAIREISGKAVDARSVAEHMAAANVITSFVFWHQFLHGAETERVRGIYQKMMDDFRLTEAALTIEQEMRLGSRLSPAVQTMSGVFL